MMSNYEECWERLFWNFANKGEQENMDLMIDIENECIGPMSEEFDAEVQLYDDGEYEYGMGFITSNKEKYRKKIISKIQDSPLMEEYEPTKNDIKEGFPADDDYSTFMKRQREWLSKKSDAQLKKMLKKAYPNGLEKKIDLDEKVLNIAGNRKGLDIMLEAEEFGADFRFHDKCEIRCPSCGDEGGMKGFMKRLKKAWDDTGYDDYESIYCPMCGEGVELVIPKGYNEYGDFIGDDDYDAEEFGAEMASLYDIVFEDDDGKKYTTHPDFDHSIINDMIEDDDLVPMDAEEYKHCDGCEEVRSVEEFSLSNDPEQTLTEGEVCDYCFGDFYDAEGINLRKRIESLIDLREINFTGFKKDTKRDAVKRARRIENELKGVLPKGKSYKVDKPKWFTIAQTGIVLGVAGLVGYSGFKGKE